MANALYLVCFKQSHFFPEDTAHWALWLKPVNSVRGTLFHVTKDSLLTLTTRYRPIPNLDPRSTSALQACVEVASELHLSEGALDRVCDEVAMNRRFDLIVNNCQRYCTEVLQRLVNDGVITQAQVDALVTKGFRPIVPKK